MPLKPEIVDQYLKDGCGRCNYGGTPQCKVRNWGNELRMLRDILTGTNLKESIKWGAPCYSHSNKNILMLSALKESVVISFFQGAGLSDPKNILENPGKYSRFARYIRFTDTQAIQSHKNDILEFVKEAVEISHSGNGVPSGIDAEIEFPDELNQAFKDNPEFESAFHSLTPGRQRGYLIHFSSAKQSSTRSARIAKFMRKILEGKGWNER